MFKMIVRWAIFLLVCVGTHGYSVKPPQYRHTNTIISDEMPKDLLFRNVDAADITSLTREDNPYRLPNTTKPVHYDIWWKVNISPPILTFSGTVNIYLHATQNNVKKIVIHSQDLVIESIKLQLDKKKISQTHSFDLDHQFLIVNLTSGSLKYNAHKPVYYRLTISFNAPMRTDMSGIYRSWYLSFGKIHWMATTQFGLIYARSAFPCYDEPAYKATFNVIISRQENFKSWSNMRRKEIIASVYEGYEDDVYHTTPVMSTYLIAMIVAEYDSVTKYEMVHGTEVVVYEVIARPEAIQTGQGDYMFGLGQLLLDELIEYTDIDYYRVNPSMKLTHAAIPDFDAGAMENWGLITYRESALMYDENNSNTYEKQLTTSTVTHESSHQWFGDLVTLEWWDATWLNEGFATFFEYFTTDRITTMGFATRFINEQVQVALIADSIDNPQPLTNTGVGSPSSVNDMFSTISYSKGGSVIRMTDHLMGSENHRHGLRKYLKARAFQTARPIDLFENLQEAALETGAIEQYGTDFNIVDYYKTWTEQGGHPILNVEVDRETGVVTIQQRQFNINNGSSTSKMNWIVPITFATASDPDFNDTKPTHIIKDANITLDLALGADEWIIFNKQQTGFYRVNYDEHSWDLIINLLRGPDRELIHEYNRAQIVDDVFQFARAGIMTYNRAFNILSFLKNETAYAPWTSARIGFSSLVNRLAGTSLEQPIKNLFMDWVSHLMADLSYLPVKDEPFLRAHLRASFPSNICRYGGEECQKTARKLFADLYNWGTEVPINIRSWVYCNGLREGNPNYYNFLLNRYMYHPVANEQVRIINLLGCVADESSLLSFLDVIFKQNFVVRPQDLANAYSGAVFGNDINTQRVFRYIQENMQSVTEKFNSISVPLFYVSSGLRSESEVKQFQDWANQNKDALGDSYEAVFNGANNVLELQKWAASVHDDINSYLTEGDRPVGISNTA